MLVFITGAHGFIGQRVSAYLAAAGHRVAGLGHGAWAEPAYRAAGLIDWINGEVSPANLDALAGRNGVPEALVHLAGGSSVGVSFVTPLEDFSRSVDGAALLAEWVRQRAPQARVVHISSAAVYGAGHEAAIAEGTPCTPFSPYGFHKRMAELLFQSYACNFGLSVAVVRLFSIYGPGLRKQLLWDTCCKLAAGSQLLELGGTGAEVRDWLHVDDAARIIELALGQASPACTVINGGTGIATPVRDIAARVCQAWGGGVAQAFSGQQRSGDPQHLVADTTCLRELGFIAGHDWQTGIDEYVAWFKASSGAEEK